MIDLWGNEDYHVKHSIELLREHEPPEGYYLAFSGGKDSTVCYNLCQKAGVKFDAHYMRAMEPPELIYFIRKYYPDVIRHLPKENMWQLIVKNGIPPLRTLRFCCRVLKEIGGKNRVVITGVRKAESIARSKRVEVNEYKNKKMVMPILHWTNEQVWEYIHKNSIPYCSLYNTQKRIGCVMCPCGGTTKMRQEALLWPKIANAYRRACNRAFDPDIAKTWANGDEMYEWWLNWGTFRPPEGQEEIWEEPDV